MTFVNLTADDPCGAAALGWPVVDGSVLVVGLQERAARALPAEFVETVGGWWLRHAPGCSWWAGTVLAHGMGEPGELVARAEEFYARHGVAARFQITPAACPDTLDGLLEGRGYHLHTPMSLRVAETGAVAAWESTVDVRVEERLTPAWLDVWRAVQGHGGDAGAQRRLLERVAQPSAYAVARIGDDVVAVGRAVEDTGWVGVFGMVTLPQARGRGAAGAVLGALAKWAASRGTERIYLQVERENPAAVRLYERAGFAEAGRFHYRG